jgi:hypothetical protein
MAASPPSHAEQKSSASPTFSFPYSYAQPTVPASVGAQGIVGLNVPPEEVGPHASAARIGASGHLGPVNVTAPDTFPKTPTRLTVTVRNGTVYSSVPAVGQVVTLTNTTFGTAQSATTSALGVATFATYVGNYLLEIIPSVPTNWVAFTQEVDLTSTSTSIIRYLTPVTNSTAVVDNCGSGGTACTGTVYGDFGVQFTSFTVGQLTVELLNESSAGALVATALTLANGSAVFEEVNTAYLYALQFVGWNTAADGVTFAIENYTSASFRVTADGSVVRRAYSESGESRWTATITGTSPPMFGAPWMPSVSTRVMGGELVLSTYLAGPSSGIARLVFVDTVLYLNCSGGNDTNLSHLGISFVNSTVIELSDADVFGSLGGPYGLAWLYLNNTAFFGSGLAGADGSGNPLPCTLCQNSIIVAKTATWPPTGTVANPAPGGGAVSGRIVNSEFYGDFDVPLVNVSLVAVSVANSNLVSAGIGDPFDEHSHFSLIGVRVLSNSSLQIGTECARACASPGATSVMVTDSALNDSEVSLDAGWVNVTNSWLNETYLWGGGNVTSLRTDWTFGHDGLMPRAHGRFVNDFISEQAPSYVPFSNYYSNAIPYYPLQWHSIQMLLPEDTNISRSYLQFGSVASNNLTIIDKGDLSMYDDVFDANATPAALAEMVSDTTHPDVGEVYLVTYAEWWMNFTDFDCSTFCYEAAYGNESVAHTYFPWLGAGLQYGEPFQMFAGGTVLPFSVSSFTNDTFAYVYVNTSLAWGLSHAYRSDHFFFEAAEWLEDANQPVADGGWFNATHDTFLARPAGIAYSGVAADIRSFQNGVRANVSDDLFANLESYNEGPNATLAPGYGYDVLVQSHPATYVTGNWFLNLNNKTVPVGTNWCGATPACSGSTAVATDPTLALAGNHYYWAPSPASPGDSDPTGPLHPSQYRALPVEYYTDESLYSNIPYELPLAPGTDLISASDYQLVSNTSVNQTDSPSPAYYTPYSWSWSVAPDVSAASGTPEISYAYGLDAGSQPDFFWKGYTYTAAVEPSCIQVGANSDDAPPVEVQFADLVAHATYVVLGYAGAGGAPPLSNVTLVASVQGTVTVDYTPAADPALETFVVACAKVCQPLGGAAPGPSGFLGFPIEVWVGLAAVVVAIAVGMELRRNRSRRSLRPLPSLSSRYCPWQGPRPRAPHAGPDEFRYLYARRHAAGPGQEAAHLWRCPHNLKFKIWAEGSDMSVRWTTIPDVARRSGNAANPRYRRTYHPCD